MYKPFPYQQKLIGKARDKLAHGSKGVFIVSPAGSGKSVVIAEIARLTTEKGNRVWFMVHRKELVEQITASFKEQDVNMNLTTIMTVRRLANRLGKLPKPQLIITDETHHSLAKTYQKIYDYYPDVPRLGFSATPWRMNKQSFTDIYTDMVEGPKVDWLIEHHFLAPFNYKVAMVNGFNEEKLESRKNNDFTNDSIDDALGKTIFGDAFNKWCELGGSDRKTIIYCHSIAYSEQVAAKFRENGINAVHVDAKTPAKERDQIMADFKANKIQVLCNVDLISEGFNVPDCSCVVLLRPTKSLVLYIQQAMRCMRYKKGKKALIIDMVANATRLQCLPNTDFDWWGYFKGDYHNGNTEQPTTCQSCFSSFFRSDKNARQQKVVKQDDIELTTFKTTSWKPVLSWVIDRFGEYYKLKDVKLYSQIICPICHGVAQETEYDPDKKQGEKDVENAEYIDVSDPHQKMVWLASLSTTRAGICRTYDIFQARFTLEGKKKDPIYSTLSIRMRKAKGHTISKANLAKLARHLNRDYDEIESIYEWCLKNFDFEEHKPSGFENSLLNGLANDFY